MQRWRNLNSSLHSILIANKSLKPSKMCRLRNSHHWIIRCLNYLVKELWSWRKTQVMTSLKNRWRLRIITIIKIRVVRYSKAKDVDYKVPRLMRGAKEWLMKMLDKGLQDQQVDMWCHHQPWTSLEKAQYIRKTAFLDTKPKHLWDQVQVKAHCKMPDRRNTPLPASSAASSVKLSQSSWQSILGRTIVLPETVEPASVKSQELQDWFQSDP